MSLDWVGFDSVSYGELMTGLWFGATFGGVVLAVQVLFGGLRLKRAKAKKRKAKTKKRSRR